jgi:hypothetical protein
LDECRLFRVENGYFPKNCVAHFRRNIAAKCPKLWRAGGDDAVNNFLYATSYETYCASRFVLQNDFSPIWQYMVKSERDQGVFTEEEMTKYEFLRESYTLVSLAEYCRLTGAAWSHHLLGELPISTDNNVEQVFAVDKRTKLRFLGPLEFLQGKADQLASVLHALKRELDPWLHALIPNVHAVFEDAKRKANSFEVSSRGNFGHRVVTNRRDRTVLHVNVLDRTCNGTLPDCLRPALTKECCCHLIAAHSCDGTAALPTFFSDNYPAYFLTSTVRELLDKGRGMKFVPPNINLCPLTTTHSTECPSPGPAKPAKRGRKVTNTERALSRGEAIVNHRK